MIYSGHSDIKFFILFFFSTVPMISLADARLAFFFLRLFFSCFIFFSLYFQGHVLSMNTRCLFQLASPLDSDAILYCMILVYLHSMHASV